MKTCDKCIHFSFTGTNAGTCNAPIPEHIAIPIKHPSREVSADAVATSCKMFDKAPKVRSFQLTCRDCDHFQGNRCTAELPMFAPGGTSRAVTRDTLADNCASRKVSTAPAD